MYEFIDDYKYWIPYLVAAIAGVWVWLIKKGSAKVVDDKTRAETADILFAAQVSKDKRVVEKNLEAEATIDRLNLIIKELTKQYEILQKVHAEVLVKVEEAKAQITMWKTIHN